MKLNKPFFKELKKQLKKDWGSCCWSATDHRQHNFSIQCPACEIWLAFNILEDLYDLDEKIKISKE